MAESFSEVGKAAQDMASHALQAGLVGGAFSFIVSTDNVQVTQELCSTAVEVTKQLSVTAVEIIKQLSGPAVELTKQLGGTAVELTKELGGTAVKLGAIYAGYQLLRPLIDVAVKRAFGGERDDQNVQEIKPGSLHVLLRCFTDERFLQVLADYELGRIKERLQIEFSRTGIKTEGLKVEIENMEEVNKIKAAINKRSSYPTEVMAEGEEKTTKKIDSLVTDVDEWKLSTRSRKNQEMFLGHLEKYLHEAKCTIKKRGIEGAQKLIKLERWQEVEMNLAVFGNSGVGKSSFINAVRGVENDDPEAAKTGTVEATMIPTEYSHPSNQKIKLWKLPAIGTPAFPDLQIFCKRVDIEKYDAFIIINASRFTEIDIEFAKKLESIDKPFLVVRTKIDNDFWIQRRKRSFNEEKMLKIIREYSFVNFNGLIAHEDDIFLISNHFPDTWDFPRLTEAIMDILSHDKQESFCLSTDILERKVNALKGQIWMVALKSINVKAFTTSYSYSIDFKIIEEQVEFYRSQLGFPEKDSKEFQGISEELQKQVQRFYFSHGMDIKSWLKKFDSDGDGADEDLPHEWMGPFKFVCRSLYCILDEMKYIATNILRPRQRPMLELLL